jgi:hypothetical protein
MRTDAIRVVAFVSVIMLSALSAEAQTVGDSRAKGRPFPNTAHLAPSSDSSLPKQPNASTGWIDGTFHFQYGTNCQILGGAYEENLITSFAGYWGSSDASYPAVGDLYWGRVFASIPGNACADGITDVLMYVKLPSNTYLYSDASNSIHCFYKGPGASVFQDVTNDPNASCQKSPSFYTQGYYMAWPILPTGAQFYVQFPIYSTSPHSGIADSTSNLLAQVESNDTPASSPSQANNSPQRPNQWVFVAANPPTIAYPAPSTTLITNTSARTSANLNNHYVSGTLYFDLGTTTAYGDLASTPIPNTTNNQVATVDWGGMPAGTTHHWRARFVSGAGTVNGTDQTFTTGGTSVIPRRRGDFNLDGRADLVWRNGSTGTSTVWMMNGTGIGAGSGTNALQINASYSVAGTGDFNGDGKADLVWRNTSTGDTILWLMDGTNIIAGSGYLGSVPPPWQIAGVGDFNGDTRSDLLWRNMSTGVNSIWLLNGTTVQPGSGTTLTIADMNWAVGGVGDFNHDGRSDIFWRNNTTSTSSIWMMNGTALGGDSGTLLTIGSLWHPAAVADLDGNGYSDIVWRNSSTGQNILWLMAGTAVAPGSGEMLQVADLNWNIWATGDFNGDGREDLAWRNNVTGLSSMWLMGAGGIAIGSGSGTLLDVPPPWAIAGPR